MECTKRDLDIWAQMFRILYFSKLNSRWFIQVFSIFFFKIWTSKMKLQANYRVWHSLFCKDRSSLVMVYIYICCIDIGFNHMFFFCSWYYLRTHWTHRISLFCITWVIFPKNCYFFNIHKKDFFFRFKLDFSSL